LAWETSTGSIFIVRLFSLRASWIELQTSIPPLCDIVASGARFGIIEGKTLPSSSVPLKLVSDYNFSGEKGVIVGREAEFRTRRNVSPSPDTNRFLVPSQMNL
jgi:hypothetical protein